MDVRFNPSLLYSMAFPQISLLTERRSRENPYTNEEASFPLRCECRRGPSRTQQVSFISQCVWHLSKTGRLRWKLRLESPISGPGTRLSKSKQRQSSSEWLRNFSGSFTRINITWWKEYLLGNQIDVDKTPVPWLNSYVTLVKLLKPSDLPFSCL